MISVGQRASRRELDRLTGEIMRRWDEDGDACVALYAKRCRLRRRGARRRALRRWLSA